MGLKSFSCDQLLTEILHLFQGFTVFESSWVFLESKVHLKSVYRVILEFEFIKNTLNFFIKFFLVNL